MASLRLIVIAALAFSAGGCAVGNMGSMFGAKSSDGTQALALDESTGTAGLRRVAGRMGAAETDLVFARMAIVDVLSRGSKGVSAPWENPSSGARGTVTPIANAYARDGGTCHDFLASYVLQGVEAWYQGEACRPHRGKWEVKSLRPWTRT